MLFQQRKLQHICCITLITEQRVFDTKYDLTLSSEALTTFGRKKKKIEEMSEY